MSESSQGQSPNLKVSWHTEWSDYSLSGSAIDVWRIHSDWDGYEVGSFFECLSSEERERADRFHFERDRRSFRVSHACKRRILGRYLATDPQSLRFVTGQWGKPMLAPACNPDRLSFNLSHSKGMTLLGVTRGVELGVDVEGLQSAERMDPIFRRFASDQEKGCLGKHPDGERGDRLTAWWVCKEAFLKTVVRGLSLSLSEFSVVERDSVAWGFEGIPEEFGVGGDYVLQLISVGEGHRAAIAIRATECEIRGVDGDRVISSLGNSSGTQDCAASHG